MSFSSRIYEAVPGFFVQDNPNVTTIEPIPRSFGLLDTSTDRWSKFFDTIAKLNAEADTTISYKVFFLGRHGEGFHNVAEAKYGTLAWDDHWSKLDGDGELVWGPDPELTDTGIRQAETAREAWRKEIVANLPLPDIFYSSPLSRALRTCMITFTEHMETMKKPMSALVLENCREHFGEHTCDKRRSKTFILSTFPQVKTEKDFTENDEVWTDERETNEHVALRGKAVLDYIFHHDKGTFISITGHGGIINGILASMGRPLFPLPTGGVLPVVVKGRITDTAKN